MVPDWGVVLSVTAVSVSDSSQLLPLTGHLHTRARILISVAAHPSRTQVQESDDDTNTCWLSDRRECLQLAS